MRINANIDKLPIFNETVTVFCKQPDDVHQTLKWFRYILPKAFWLKITASKVNGNDTGSKTTFVCRILKSSQYMPPEAWIPSSGFTLRPGDVICCGSTNETIPDGQSANAFLALHPDAFIIGSVKVNTKYDLLAHYHCEGERDG